MKENPSARKGHAGRCAILGRPNVGKSTLLNSLLGQKLAIATDKPQTTRACILGVYQSKKPPLQIAFVDTPGMHKPFNALGRMLMEEAKAALADTEVIVVITDAANTTSDDDVLAAAFSTGRPVILAINKVDKIKAKSKLLPLLEQWSKKRDFAAIIPISAARAQNLDSLVNAIAEHLPEGLMYENDFLTDRPERFFVSETIREAAIRNTKQEVPHGIAVVIDEYEDGPKLVRLAATLLVERPSHKKIVIGAEGAMLKRIGTEARLELEEMLGKKVFLQLWVKVLPDWTNKPNEARRILQN